jgi:hypothetical protein
MISQAVALAAAIHPARAQAGYWTYAATLTALASLISVLNARRPGEGAWAALMALLVLVFLLIPWLESSELARPVRDEAPWRLPTPWNHFYLFLVLTGVTNYLPTRYGPAAVWLALGFGIEYLELTRGATMLGLGGSIFPATLALAYWTADACAGFREASRGSLESLWLWFRNHWGVVWALRVRERFNRSAQALDWPIRLGWYGVIEIRNSDTASNKHPIIPNVAEATFCRLLGRFADPERIRLVLKSPITSEF